MEAVSLRGVLLAGLDMQAPAGKRRIFSGLPSEDTGTDLSYCSDTVP